MKTIAISTLVIGGLIGILSIKVEGDQYQGYTQMVSRVVSSSNSHSDRVHDLDLTKYRPNMPSR